jgi:hypothetical protein
MHRYSQVTQPKSRPLSPITAAKTECLSHSRVDNSHRISTSKKPGWEVESTKYSTNNKGFTRRMEPVMTEEKLEEE